jgi:hypothetical protein
MPLKKITGVIDDIGLDDVGREAHGVLKSWKDEALGSAQLGFTFASALAWNEVMKSVAGSLMKTGRYKSAVAQTTAYALSVTFLAGVVTYTLKKTNQKQKRQFKLA